MMNFHKPQGELSVVNGITLKWVFSGSVSKCLGQEIIFSIKLYVNKQYLM